MNKTERMVAQVVVSGIGLGIAYVIGFVLVFPLLIQNNVRPDYSAGLAVLVFAIILAFWIKKLVVKIGK